MKRVVLTLLLASFLAFLAVSSAHGSKHPHAKGRYFWKHCRGDFEKFCKNVATEPFNHKAPFESQCIKENEFGLSPVCREAMAKWRAEQGKPDDNSNNDNDNEDDKGKDEDEDFSTCAEDMKTMCPEMSANAPPHIFFNSPCFKHNKNSLSESCNDYYNRWQAQRSIIFGMMISSSFIVLFSGLFLCLCSFACLACCLSRRRRRARLCRRKRVAALAKKMEEAQPEIPEQQYGYAMQTFPASSTATSPYSAYPQFYQPVLFFPPSPEQGQ